MEEVDVSLQDKCLSPGELWYLSKVKGFACEC